VIAAGDAAPALAEWQALPDAAVAAWVRRYEAGTALCLEATRRWFYFDHLAGAPPPADPRAYLTASVDAAVALITLLLDHGIDPLFFPLQAPLRRGVPSVAGWLAEGIPPLLAHPGMEALYRTVRVRAYGPWPPLPAGFEAAAAAHAALQAQFASVTARTAGNRGPRLFWRVQFNPADPANYLQDTDQAAEVLALAASLQAARGRPPTRSELIAAYYALDPGEMLPPLRLLLSGMLYDLVGQTVPPLLGGHEDLYFPLTSLFSLDRPLLRAILYDWLFLRPHPPDAPLLDYAALPPADRAALVAWHTQHRHAALGLGTRHPQGGFWYPLASLEH
jgi:hypothetical protein